MYSAQYGFSNPAGPPYNGAPPPQNPHMQPSPGQGQPPQQQQQQQHPQQQQQQMMYNPQQFPMGAQGSFGGGPNMMPGGPGPMMQSGGMPQMAPNGQVSYQPPYSGSPYAGGTQSSASPQPHMQQNYGMMPGGMPGSMPGYPMQGAGMAQQQAMMQRMQQAPQQSPNAMGTPQRQFSGQQGAAGGPMGGQQAFMNQQGPQHTPQQQASSNGAHPNPSASTPQTPTFPSIGAGAVNGVSGMSTPLSPGTEAKEKEVFTVLLEINQELLCESLVLQNLQLALRSSSGTGESTPTMDPAKMSDEEKLVQQDYVACMRRLQANFTYMASVADRKPSVPMAKGPAYLTAPPMNMAINLKAHAAALTPTEPADSKADPTADREEREKVLKELYKKLQGLYPGVDPKKEPAFPPVPGAPQAGQQSAVMPLAGSRPMGGRDSGQASPAAGPQMTPQMANATVPHSQPANPS